MAKDNNDQKNKIKGYKNHPQLIRFRNTVDPVGLIGIYLDEIHKESLKRGYDFDSSKINNDRSEIKMDVNDGQLYYKFSHLKKKLKNRDVQAFERIKCIKHIESNPVFHVIEGDIESWERINKVISEIPSVEK